MLGSFVGTLPFFNDSVGATVVQIKANPGLIYGLYLVEASGNTPSAAYLQIFGKPAASVTLGVTVPDFVVRLAGDQSLWLPFPVPLQIVNSTGLSIAGTTTASGSSGNTISVAAAYQ